MVAHTVSHALEKPSSIRLRDPLPLATCFAEHEPLLTSSILTPVFPLTQNTPRITTSSLVPPRSSPAVYRLLDPVEETLRTTCPRPKEAPHPLDDQATKEEVAAEEVVEELDLAVEEPEDGLPVRLVRGSMEGRIPSRRLRFVASCLALVEWKQVLILLFSVLSLPLAAARVCRSPYKSSFPVRRLKMKPALSPPCSPLRVSNGNRLRSRWPRKLYLPIYLSSSARAALSKGLAFLGASLKLTVSFSITAPPLSTAHLYNDPLAQQHHHATLPTLPLPFPPVELLPTPRALLPSVPLPTLTSLHHSDTSATAVDRRVSLFASPLL